MPSQQELIALLAEPSESLAIEHKSWLNIGDRREQAVLAKAAIALANHGGGIIVIGMRGDEADRGLLSHERPQEIPRYRQDDVNAAINRVADPQLHCELQFARHPETGFEHAFVVVSGDMRVPVMSRRDVPGVIASQRCYTRKPGPRSEEPFTSAEWRTLLDRCVRAGREDMLDAIRLIVQGHAGGLPAREALELLDAFTEQGNLRWHELTQNLAEGDAGRLPQGRYELSFELQGVQPTPTLAELRRRMEQAGAIKHTGWGPFVTLHRDGLAPYVRDGQIEAWLGSADVERFNRTPGHCDFWRAHPAGRLLLIRGFDEDGWERLVPGKVFDVTLPVWRVGEALLYVGRLARQFDENATIIVRCRYFGLQGRTLQSVNGRRMLFGNQRSLDDEASLQTRVSVAEVEENLAEVLLPMLSPLYEKFDFFELPDRLVIEELAEMRANRF